MSFLDKEGLRYFWRGVKNKFYNKSEIDSQREELQKGIDDASKTGGVLDGTIVEWEEDEIPEGYEEVEDFLNGAKIRIKDLDITPVTYSNNTYLVTDIPMKNTSILSIFCKNRFGFNLIPLQYYNVSSDKWVITDVSNSLSGAFGLTIVYFEFDNDINIFV